MEVEYEGQTYVLTEAQIDDLAFFDDAVESGAMTAEEAVFRVLRQHGYDV